MGGREPGPSQIPGNSYQKKSTKVAKESFLPISFFFFSSILFLIRVEKRGEEIEKEKKNLSHVSRS